MCCPEQRLSHDDRLAATGPRLTKHTVEALASALAIATGTHAYGDVIRFDNPAGPGHFDWVRTGINETYLDVTLPAIAQPNSSTLSSFAQYSQSNVNPGNYKGTIRGAQGSAQLQVGGIGDFFTFGVGSGVMIPSGNAWSNHSYSYFTGYPSYAPSGSYIGVKFLLPDGFHYGWIGITHIDNKPDQFDAFAWGYETEPGVPIAAGAGVPAPGTLAALAFGAFGLSCGRKRKQTLN